MFQKYKKWNIKDEEYLKKNYLKKTYKKMCFDLNTSKFSVMHKCSRLGLLMPITKKNKLQALNSKQEVYDINNNFGHFVSGFVAGEGCFCIVNSGSKKEIFQFTISLTSKDEHILWEIKKILKCGHIYYIDRTQKHPTWKPEVKFTVRAKKEIYSKIIPFFDTFKLRNTLKHKQYLSWREVFLKNLNS